MEATLKVACSTNSTAATTITVNGHRLTVKILIDTHTRGARSKRSSNSQATSSDQVAPEVS